ncbi:hypothetical protein I7I51_02765 [Histoplasma capsulatum]|uniref:Uncharacterized protein n=1 Tax=Ajellomyces capsulatus TaxID=5037 RepID=A0A8A1MJB4_AJECA|nr:hypothetical protein I7I51_02765 [Histoplasma capsulatum]
MSERQKRRWRERKKQRRGVTRRYVFLENCRSEQETPGNNIAADSVVSISITNNKPEKTKLKEGGQGGHSCVPEHVADQVDDSWLAAFRNRPGHKGTGLLGGQFVRRHGILRDTYLALRDG